MRKISDRPFTSFLVMLLCFLQGCTSMRSLESGEGRQHFEQLKVDDVARITTVAGERHTLKVTSVTGEKVSGSNIDVPVSNIAKVEVKEHDTAKTTTLIVILVVGIALVILGVSGAVDEIFGLLF